MLASMGIRFCWNDKDKQAQQLLGIDFTLYQAIRITKNLNYDQIDIKNLEWFR